MVDVKLKSRQEISNASIPKNDSIASGVGQIASRSCRNSLNIILFFVREDHLRLKVNDDPDTVSVTSTTISTFTE